MYATVPLTRLVSVPPVLLTAPFNVSVLDPTANVPSVIVKALFTVTLLFNEIVVPVLLIVRL